MDKPLGLPLAATLFCVASCLSTEGLYRNRDASGVAGTTGNAGTTGAAGRGGTTGTAGTAGTTGAAGRGGTTGSAGTGGIGMQLFADDFENGIADWIINGDATFTATTDGSRVMNINSTMTKISAAANGSTAWTDQVLQARIKINSFNGSSTSYLAGLAGRMTDATHYYYVALRSDGKMAIRINNDGNTSLSSAIDTGIVTGTWYTVKFSLIGPTLTAFINGTQMAQVSNATLTNGGVGLIVENANAVFDDVVVTAP